MKNNIAPFSLILCSYSDNLLRKI